MKGKRGPVASAELFVIVNHPRKTTGTDANVPLRGVSAAALEVRPEVKIVEGRMFEQGRNEIIAGRAAAGQFANLSVGSSVRWGENTWQVVGIFEAEGNISESEIWCDAKVLQPAYRRGNSYQSVYARLDSPDSFQSFKDTLTSDPRLNVTVVRVPDYYSGQSQVLRTVISTIGMAIAGLMGIGAIFAAVNTMYMAVASRTREIATLRALGFGNVAVVFSVLAEAVFLSLIGGAVGGGDRMDCLRRLPGGDDELAVFQPGRLRVCRHPGAARPGADVRGGHGAAWGALSRLARCPPPGRHRAQTAVRVASRRSETQQPRKAPRTVSRRSVRDRSDRARPISSEQVTAYSVTYACPVAPFRPP